MLAPILPREFLVERLAGRVGADAGDQPARVDLIREGVDLALRVRAAGHGRGAGGAAPAWAAMGSLVASPAYSATGCPKAPENMAAHITLSFNEPQAEVRWTLRNTNMAGHRGDGGARLC